MSETKQTIKEKQRYNIYVPQELADYIEFRKYKHKDKISDYVCKLLTEDMNDYIIENGEPWKEV